MNKPQPLNHTREQITSLDNELLALLARRRELSLDVARSKEVDVRPIRDTTREKELLSRLVKQGREQGLDAHYVISLYQSIIEDSVLNQQAYLHGRANPETQKQQYCIAYLGARGSYSYLAATRYCDRRQVEMQDLGCQSFDEIVQAVESGHADYGFLPIENTSSGSINEVYDVLQHTSLAIVGETTIEVGHCLLANSGSTINDIKTVYAHPQPISQCSRYLSQHGQFKLEYCSSSAEAMEKVCNANDNSVAAIGSAEGGALYQLEAIESGLANQKINQSRFIVVARKAVEVPSQLPAKCTLIMATGQKPGALVEALLVLKARNLNMSKLESRPIPGTPWEEMFYLDIDANLASEPMQAALKELEKTTRFIKVLGCYPCETVKPTQLSSSQLMIEPNTSKATTVTATAQTKQQRVSKQYKAEPSQVLSGQLCLGAGQIGALSQVQLPIELPQFEQMAKSLKESGFQAVVLQGLSQQSDLINSINHFKNALAQFDLVCILAIEHETDLTIATQFADMVMLSGNLMYNQAILTQLGSLLIPVILERNAMASVDDLLNAAEEVLSQGNQQLALCESGVTTLNNSGKPSLDLAALVELKALSHLPVVVNPSYAIDAEQLPTFARAIKQLKGDGIMMNLSAIESTTQAQSDELVKTVLSNLYH
ncbi:prephenate dehydratase [Shewanella fidelis]|uniref:Prephenate dehydratase n=1 Tax=Shewanella fidelis TaxID=173509 RepID=A0AAW8NPQ6_9GAMM|nr:prephenate dehydratase [Shewanella fidelis]MDR8524755.1 prephenate dehydratase [Shewanella fidelis]MDW4810826.1 prephenate dehydratase [Shewanella fidelis]MDW4815395.1 prephenate dehydratase [Shewanella fidelis]MDW4819485.1 prephenate dehydratase [Shewanella fidelis]MDW4822837.1 prephenate dehydratase [Shewanella fidelis]